MLLLSNVGWVDQKSESLAIKESKHASFFFKEKTLLNVWLGLMDIITEDSIIIIIPSVELQTHEEWGSGVEVVFPVFYFFRLRLPLQFWLILVVFLLDRTFHSVKILKAMLITEIDLNEFLCLDLRVWLDMRP